MNLKCEISWQNWANLKYLTVQSYGIFCEKLPTLFVGLYVFSSEIVQADKKLFILQEAD